MGQLWFKRFAARRGRTALAALVAAGALGAPAASHAAVPSDAYPTPQAIAANAEFLVQAPPPPSGGTICVIDTGVTPLPDTASRITHRIAIDGGNPDDVYHDLADPFSGHGTFVAGTIASQVDGYGSAGIWPQAKIVSVRAFRARGQQAEPADYVNAIAACSQPSLGVSVVNLSLSSIAASQLELERLENRIIAARAKGINVVASAGNEGSSAGASYPARFASSFAVGATDAANAFCSFSNRGMGVDLSTFGCGLIGTAFTERIGKFDGTSYSAPIVSAALGALRAYKPSLGPSDAERLLLETADRSPSGPTLNVAAAFHAAGLDHFVSAYVPPQQMPTEPSSVGSRAESVGDGDTTSKIVVVVTRPNNPATRATARPKKPVLRRVSYRRGRLQVILRSPPEDVRAVFTVDQRVYLRSSSQLRVRVRSWRRVSVFFEDERASRSPVLTLVRRHPAPRRESGVVRGHRR